MRKATLAEFLEYAVTVPGWADLDKVVREFQLDSYIKNGDKSDVAFIEPEPFHYEEFIKLTRSEYDELVTSKRALDILIDHENTVAKGDNGEVSEELVTMSRSDYEELVINHIAVSEPVATNPILSDLVNKIEQQTAKGISKYGESVNPDNLSFVEWVDHAMEEMVDNLVYMACAKDKVLNEDKLNGKGEKI